MKKSFVLLVITLCLGVVFSNMVLADNITLTLWDIRTESDTSRPAVKDAIARFEAANPNIKIKHVPITNDNYKTKIRTAMAANNEPDIFMTWGSSSLEKYVNNNKVYNLTEHMDSDWLARFPVAALELGKVDGQYYGVPVTNMTVALVWYRKDLFNKYGLKPPKTYENLLNVVETFKDNGITPFTLANKTKWTGSMYFVYLVDRIGGPDAFKNALNRTGAFNDEPFIKAGKVIQELIKIGAFPKGVNGMDEDTAQSRAMLYADKAAMYLMGSWTLGSMNNENPELINNGKIGFFNFPAFKDGKGDPSNLIGTPGDNYYSITQKCRYKDAAVKFLKYLTDQPMAEKLVEIGNIPPLNGAKDKIKDPILKGVYEQIQKAAYVQLWYDQSLPLELAQVHLNTTQALFGLQMTPEEAANKMEAAAKEYYGE
ncbi:extracellular solute-binding protein [Iocasia frigidifontis]|uniref:Extracellular solute-binding protein n=1 Tax=Iocasia fonsfrigidae TaxID=2682810 RepID=A0A8A7KG28_9FIRM|nr:extracellular solute-binding protein [Iocasia fonsfrigidae]QTL99045.1 extracellular solute-binding protein [Iocasia fonsfrigidae]